jgi:hypothetical protein
MSALPSIPEEADVIPFERSTTLPATEDLMGEAARRFHGRVCSLEPWGLLQGSNGHLCVVFRSVYIVEAATPAFTPFDLGWETLCPAGTRNLVGNCGGIESISPIRIHVSINEEAEYHFPISAQQKLRAVERLDAVRVPAHQLPFVGPGLGVNAMGGVLTWYTQWRNGEGHSECLYVARVPPVQGEFSPSRSYELYICRLQEALHRLLDGLRVDFTLPPKSTFHVSLKRVSPGQVHVDREVW